MKKLFLLLFVSMGYFFSSYGQEKLTFSKVIEVKDVDKTSIYISLRDWISTYYRDTQEVLQMDDKDAGIIIGKAIFLYSMNNLAYAAYEGKIWYSIKLHIPADTRSAFPVISVQSPVSIQCCWQS